MDGGHRLPAPGHLCGEFAYARRRFRLGGQVFSVPARPRARPVHRLGYARHPRNELAADARTPQELVHSQHHRLHAEPQPRPAYRRLSLAEPTADLSVGQPLSMVASPMGAPNTRDDQMHTPESRHTADLGSGRAPFPEAHGLSESVIATGGHECPCKDRGAGLGLLPPLPQQGWQDRGGLSLLKHLEHLTVAGERVSQRPERLTGIRSGAAERNAPSPRGRELRWYAVGDRHRDRRGGLRTAARRAHVRSRSPSPDLHRIPRADRNADEESADLAHPAAVRSQSQAGPPRYCVPGSGRAPRWGAHRVAANNTQLGGPRWSDQRRQRR